jgi:ankyrin repeat protein
MKFLKRNGYDFELQGTLDRTPLLDHSAQPGAQNLAIVRLLLEFGANSYAVGSHGCNAIHLAMRSNIHPEFPEILEEKLSALIEAGVDLHYRNRWGSTPSYYARRLYKCWAVWCRALKRNGRKIDDVVREDGEL